MLAWHLRVGKQRALEQLVKPGMTVADIGAQAGFYTLLFSCVVQEGGKVYAFEPFSENIEFLLAHIRMNDLHNVQVVQVALSDRTSLAGFSVDRGRSQNRIANVFRSPLVLPTFSLDEVIEVHRLRPPDLIKLDAEGAESLILKGAQRTIKRYRPILFVAMHGEEQRGACRTLLEEWGYGVYALDGGRITGNRMADEVYALWDEREQAISSSRRVSSSI